MDHIYGIVSCDVIDSTSLEVKDLMQLRNEVNSMLFPKLEDLYPGFWGRVVRGDTIECCIKQAQYSFRVALLIKCWFKIWAAEHNASRRMWREGVRYSIGIGPMRSIDRKEDFLDGDAIYIAGRNLDYISQIGLSSYFGMSDSNKPMERLVKNNLLLVDNIIRFCTVGQVPILFDRLCGLTETEISRKLLITQGAVNQRSQGAGWHLIKRTLEILESIDYERYFVQ